MWYDFYPTSCVFSIPEPWQGDRKTHNELDINHITSQTMGVSFYHIYTTPYLFLLTFFFGRRGVKIHDVITKNYHMSVITLISRKICDKIFYHIFTPLSRSLGIENTQLVGYKSYKITIHTIGDLIYTVQIMYKDISRKLSIRSVRERTDQSRLVSVTLHLLFSAKPMDNENW
jgi:hypothetical protein